MIKKTRLVEQNDLSIRKQFDEKEQALESLKIEASRLLRERDDTINVLKAQVWKPFDASADVT